MSTVRHHEKCLVCESPRLKALKGYPKTQLVKCGACSFTFSRLIPTTQELVEHYENTYGRNDYLSPVTVARYHEILDEFEPYKKTGRLLDVGCGIGLFAEVALERGWEVHGTEFTDEAVQICQDKGIRMKSGILDANNYEPESFDIITSFEVIEHINNPAEDVTEVVKLLRKGGLFYGTTPNFNSTLRYLLGERYNVVCYPEHLSYYTRASITHLMQLKGLRKLKVLTTGFSPTHFRNALFPAKEQQRPIAPDSGDEKLRRSMENNKSMGVVKKVANGILSTLGIGDSLKFYFEKS